MNTKVSREQGHVRAGSEVAARVQALARLESDLRDANDGMKLAERYIKSMLNWSRIGQNDGERTARYNGILEGHIEPYEEWLDEAVAKNTPAAARERMLEDVKARAQEWRRHRDSIALWARARDRVEAELAARKEYRRGIEWATREALAGAVKETALAKRGKVASGPGDLNIDAVFGEIIDEQTAQILSQHLGAEAQELGRAGAPIGAVAGEEEEESDFAPEEIPF